MDLKQYRLENWEWLTQAIERYGSEAYHVYRDKIFKMLYQLRPGKMYDFTGAKERGSKIFTIEFEKDGIRQSEENPDLFVKVCCTFILMNQDYVFSEDYSSIKRMI